MTRSWWGLLFGLVMIMAIVVGTVVMMGMHFLASPGSPVAKQVIYEVNPGRSFVAIANDLEAAGVIQSSKFFSIYGRLTGKRAKIKAGEFQFNTSMKPGAVMRVLNEGKSIARPFTISEGLNIFEIADLYERNGFGRAKEFMSLVRDPSLVKTLIGPEAATLEGYLFPETYQITKFTTTRELIVAMVRRFEAVYKEVEALGPQTMNRHQIVTFASLIEKETGAPQERPLISSVFHNRILKKMRLQTDPTIIYGMAMVSGRVPKNIRRADILAPTAYNTYVIAGLPPGPIANPGREALLAVIKPVPSTYLYFVSRNDGTHVFTSTYDEHNRAVREFQMNAKAREGKSWRDLNKSK